MRLRIAVLFVAVATLQACSGDPGVEPATEKKPETVRTSPDHQPVASSGSEGVVNEQREPEEPVVPRSEGRVIPEESSAESRESASSRGELRMPIRTVEIEERGAALAGTYELASIDGKGLPAVTDTRPGCRIEVRSGHLSIDQSSRFELETTTRETCDGEITAEDVWGAAGTVSRDGHAVRFGGSSGDAFGHAEGVIDSGLITIYSIATEGGTEEVNWKFGRQ